MVCVLLVCLVVVVRGVLAKAVVIAEEGAVFGGEFIELGAAT
jgi:hypothetical protein